MKELCEVLGSHWNKRTNLPTRSSQSKEGAGMHLHSKGQNRIIITEKDKSSRARAQRMQTSLST